MAVLAEAAGDGRLTLGEHSDRTERACSARTLGELAALTADLALPAEQPIRVDGHRPVLAVARREQRDGRWVVPARLAVTVAFGEAVLDLREAVLHSHRTVLFAMIAGGRLQLIVPDSVTVAVTGRVLLSSVRGPLAARAPGRGSAGLAAAQAPVIEVCALGVGAQVKVIRPRRSRWGGLLGRRGSA